MKKFTFLFFACVMAMASCEDQGNDLDDDQSKSEAEALPEKIVMSFGGETETYTITYEEGTKKIDRISSTGKVEIYKYEGNNVRKTYFDSENDGDYNEYTYDTNGRLIKEERYRSGEDEPEEVTEIDYSSTKPTVSFNEEEEVEITFDSKGNMTGASLKQGDEAAGAVSITYDDKYAPFRNVAGWAKVRYLVGAPLGENIGYEDILGAGSNPLKLTGTFFGESVDITYVYEFKDDKNPKFPTKVTGTKKVGTEYSEAFEATITYKQ